MIFYTSQCFKTQLELSGVVLFSKVGSERKSPIDYKNEDDSVCEKVSLFRLVEVL